MYSNTKINETIFAACSAAVMSLVCIFTVLSAFEPKHTVNFQDLTIESPAGAADLAQRLHAASQHVCFGSWDTDAIRVQRVA